MEDTPERERSESSADANADPPWLITIAGKIGVKLAILSLGTTVLGIITLSLNISPYGLVILTLSLGGVSVAMLLAVVYQTYAGDVGSPQGLDS